MQPPALALVADVRRIKKIGAAGPYFFNRPMSPSLQKYLILLSITGISISSVFFSLQQELSWYDAQRIYLVLAAVLSATTLNRSDYSWIPTPIIIFLGIGIFSSIHSSHRYWSLVEVASMIGCILIALRIATIHTSLPRDTNYILLTTIYIITIGIIGAAIIAYTALLFELKEIDFWLLIQGFSNPRFFGQFSTLCIPILAAPILIENCKKRKIIYCLILSLFWWLTISSGTRGTILGLTLGLIAPTALNKQGKRLFILLTATAITGMILYAILNHIIPNTLDLKLTNKAIDRVSTSLSLREYLWIDAINATLESPLLGGGPMHFASIKNQIANHPHNSILQISSEWGLIALAFLLITLKTIASNIYKFLRTNEEKPSNSTIIATCLTTSLLSSSAQSLVDGNFVTPYSLLWISIISGWLWSYASQHTTQKNIFRNALIQIVSIFLIFILTIKVHQEAPKLKELDDIFIKNQGGIFKPRFWRQGSIEIANKSLTNTP